MAPDLAHQLEAMAFLIVANTKLRRDLLEQYPGKHGGFLLPCPLCDSFLLPYIVTIVAMSCLPLALHCGVSL